MNKKGPVVVIEDDMDDQEIFRMVYLTSGYTNEIIFFEDPVKAYEFLNLETVHPFMVISDINMPRLNGFELRNLIRTSDRLRKKCIPYLFLSTGTSPANINKAYELSVQGFFCKPDDLKDYEEMLLKMLEYWRLAYSP